MISVIPFIVLIIIFYGFIKKINIYDSFLDGAKEGLITVFNIVPSIVAMVFAINIFLNSGVVSWFISLLHLNELISIEISSLVLLRPVSGSACIAILNNVYKLYGPDSFNGFLASVIQGCTDTTIYVLALYFGSIKITKSRYALIVGLLADAIGIIAAFIFSNIFF